MTDTTTTTKSAVITPPTEMTYQDRLIIKNTCDKIIRCMSQFSKYTKKEMMSDDYLDDYEEYEDYEKSTSIPIYSYRNENPLDGLCKVIPNLINESYKGSIITLSHYKDDRPCEENTSWGFPVSRFTKTNNIYNAVVACELFYEHFTSGDFDCLKGEVAEMLLEEYRKEPLFMKEVA